jgi:glyoxalase family protein
VEHIETTKRFNNNEQVITFVDYDGVKLELVASEDAENRKINAWKNGPIPVDYAIRGLHSVTLSLEEYEKTSSLLTGEMGFSKMVDEDNRVRFQIKDRIKEAILNDLKVEKDQNFMDSTPSIVDVIVLPYSHNGTSGPGTVHHVAWQTPTNESQLEMRTRITKVGLNTTPIIDRNYFNSVYFREPGGVLFEIATNTPGFLLDQKPEELGQKLILPKWLEYKRIYIEKTLPSITLPSNQNANA